ncbi:MAG: hypothetical protein NZ780_04565 [Candidatus Poseidoniales archaeon]|nr:hypothetical protein [Candidatus Poseidoniales archaeon]MEC8938245.1 hypothetical protein [Candidatus Thermoplasmatota archaeon]MEC9393968.1 hypothetical protein [Candidatus Thermoplasmatota archaeon]MEC9477534.1 hypothetical protein [Candidatus Thermoplasmatota archaeon]MED6313191.1 hypothetical protein [Candidatus Thermoplasmatota archaeon]
MLDSIANLLIVVVTLLILGFILAREVIKRWRIGLRITAADESLLTDNSVSVKMITDAPEGSVIVSHVPAIEINE